MLKFQQNRTKPQLLRILFVTSLDKGRWTDVSVKKNPRELKIEWEHLFRTFLRGFRWKNDLGRLQKKMKQKRKPRWYEEPIINSICGLCQVQIIKSLLLDNFSLRSQQMVPNYFLYPYKYPEFHLRNIWPQLWANRHFSDGVSHYDQVLRWLAY